MLRSNCTIGQNGKIIIVIAGRYAVLDATVISYEKRERERENKSKLLTLLMIRLDLVVV